MNAGRLAWRTPTGAMLWEIWGRHKTSFLWQGVALASSAVLCHCKEHGASQELWEPAGHGFILLLRVGVSPFAGLFRVTEPDAGPVQLGFPRRLLLKPLSTARLVLVPMFFGGAIIWPS